MNRSVSHQKYIHRQRQQQQQQQEEQSSVRKMKEIFASILYRLVPADAAWLFPHFLSCGRVHCLPGSFLQKYDQHLFLLVDIPITWHRASRITFIAINTHRKKFKQRNQTLVTWRCCISDCEFLAPKIHHQVQSHPDTPHNLKTDWNGTSEAIPQRTAGVGNEGGRGWWTGERGERKRGRRGQGKRGGARARQLLHGTSVGDQLKGSRREARNPNRLGGGRSQGISLSISPGLP